MKSSQILVSALFGAFAAAVPFKRDLITKTEIAVETVVVYTTVWDDEVPAATATTTAGGYSHWQPASSEAKTTRAAISTPAYTPSAVQEPSSVYTPPVQTSAAPAPSSTVVIVSSAAPAPETSSAAPAVPTTTEAAYTPAPVVSSATSAAPAATSAAAAPATQQQSASTSSGQTYSGDLTINPLTGALGACGKPLYATDMVVALAEPAWGASTYDVQTGAATNPWCGKKINIDYNGKTVSATIMDMCPGCSGDDLDLGDAVWSAIGMTEYTRVKGTWSVAE